jgi:hypothetical protein
MNILTDLEAHRRDEEFDAEDAKRHRSKCIPSGACYLAADGNHFCSVHDPEPWLYRIQLSDEIIPFKTFDDASRCADRAHELGRHVISIYRGDLLGPILAHVAV